MKFRAESPGWPIFALADFVDAFDEGVEDVPPGGCRAGQKLANQPNERHEVDAMLLELADHDGDIDLAVQLLGEGTYVQYGAIVVGCVLPVARTKRSRGSISLCPPARSGATVVATSIG